MEAVRKLQFTQNCVNHTHTVSLKQGKSFVIQDNYLLETSQITIEIWTATTIYKLGTTELVYHRHLVLSWVTLILAWSLHYIPSQQNTFAIGFEYFYCFCFPKWNYFSKDLAVPIFDEHIVSSQNTSSQLNLSAIHSKFSNYFAAHISMYYDVFSDFWTIQIFIRK